MDKHCKYCDRPCKPRKDRPGKSFTLCDDHYAEYQRVKNRESYYRHRDARVQRARNWRQNNPEAYRASYQKYEAKPGVQERKRAYMRLYNAPYRAHVKDACETCGYSSIYDDRRDLDVHHLDGNHQNNDLSNLQTLCVPCHRGINHGGALLFKQCDW